MRPAYPAAGDRQRPDQHPPARARQGPAITPAGPGPPGDMGLADRPLRDRRPDQSDRRSSRHRPRQDLVHQDPAPRPPYRHRYGGLPPQDWDQAIPNVLAEISRRTIPKRLSLIHISEPT